MHETIFTDRTARAFTTTPVTPLTIPRSAGGHPPDSVA
jgi:hypothetical protein